VDHKFQLLRSNPIIKVTILWVDLLTFLEEEPPLNHLLLIYLVGVPQPKARELTSLEEAMIFLDLLHRCHLSLSSLLLRTISSHLAMISKEIQVRQEVTSLQATSKTKVGQP
jgi:hypothetical protein